MRHLKNYIFAGLAAIMTTSCSDFLDTAPKDAITPATAWQTEKDANKFLTGCYNNWQDNYDSGWGWDAFLLYWDGASDFGYAQYPWEGYTPIGNGQMTSTSGRDFYEFSKIRRCNELLNNIDRCKFEKEETKKDIKAQARWIRAYRYFLMNWNYGAIPIIDNYDTAESAMVEQKSEAEVRAFIEQELDELVNDIKKAPSESERGRVAKGAAYALRMREALYNEQWAIAKDRAEKIIELGLYDLDPSYANLFTIAGQNSKEIILAVQHIENTKTNNAIGRMYDNGDGGWSSAMPTWNLVDTYEMANGKTIDDPTSGYDPAHPFNNRDPRMAMTICYPGCDYINGSGKNAIFNSLDAKVTGMGYKDDKNPNYKDGKNNNPPTGLIWGKYLAPQNQYANIWNTACSPIVFRYAEVLLTWCEAANELDFNANKVKIYEYLDKIRDRVGMPAVDQTKYNDQNSVRELIRRERGVEFAGEGIRRDDILRWKTADGKRVAEVVLNQKLESREGTVNMDANVAPGMRATFNGKTTEIETRVFKSYNRYLPLPQGALNANKKLKDEHYN